MSWRSRVASVLIASLLFSLIAAALPPAAAPVIAPHIAAASGETLASPRYISAAVMPNGQVGLLFQNNGTEIRFTRYTSEDTLGGSIQLSTAAPAYPQLATFKGELVAAYVGTASKLAFRISTDNGATWSSETFPFGTTTFASDAGFAPVVVTSKDQQSLYVFTATSGSVPQYRVSTDATLATWSSAVAAGDSSMHATSSNQCGNAGQECSRAHAFQFMETAVSGRWLFITKSASGWGQSGRGTQYGTLGGSWSTQIDLFGSGNYSGSGGQSTATTFLDRNGVVYYLRADEYGTQVYFQQSTDNGASWGPPVNAYTSTLGAYATGAPVGLYVPTYSQGEYVWWAGFGGIEDTVRVTGLWSGPAAYPDTGTARLFGSNGGDWDNGHGYAYTFGQSAAAVGTGAYTTGATDLALPGRLLPFQFTRAYTSADTTAGPLGPGWTHSYNWSLTENGDRVWIRRGDGRRDTFLRNTDGTYSAEQPGVFDVLTRNTDHSYTLTLTNQVQYEFSGPSQDSPYAAAVGTDTPAAYWRLNEGSGTTAADSGPNADTGTYTSGTALGLPGALHDPSTAVAFNGAAKVTAGVTGVPTGTTARTVEAWIDPTGNGGTIFATNAASGQKFIVQAFQTGGTWYLFTDGANGANNITLSGAEVPPAGVWSHIAFTFDGSANTWHYYLNGVATKSGTFGVAINTATLSSTTIADRLDYSQPFSGSIDEVAVYGSALSAARIAAHYAAGGYRGGLLTRIHEPAGNELTFAYTGRELTTITDTVGRQIALSYDAQHHLVQLADPASRTVAYAYDPAGRLSAVWDTLRAPGGQYPTGVLADGPAGYWRLGESSGTSAADASTHANTGTYSGGYTLGQAGGLQQDTNHAVAFNGSTAKVTAGVTAMPSGSSARTVEAWVKPSGSGGTIAALNAASGQKFIVTALQSGGTWYLFTDGANGANNVTISGAEVPPSGVWSHVAFVFNGSANTWDYYLNGTLAKSGTFGVAINSATPTSVTIGERLDYSQPFNGALDEVAVYPSALTAARIADHYRAGQATSWSYTYDGASQHIATITDPDGRLAVANTFDSAGRLATQTDGRAKQTSFSYGTSTTTITDPRGHATTATFDPRQKLLEVSDIVGSHTYTLEYAYDTQGNRTMAVDREGNRTDFTYDTVGDLLTRTDPQLDPSTARAVTTWTYDGKHNVATVTDPRSFVTTNTYHSTSNVLLATSSQIDATTSATTKYEYADSANPGLATKIISPRGNTTGTPNYTYSQSLSYDSSANLVQRIDADGAKTTYAYDSLGRRTAMVDPDGYATGAVAADHTWTTAYDAADRVTSQTDPLGNSTTATYDGLGNKLTATDPNGNVTTYTYDGTARLVTVVQQPDPAGQPTVFYTTTVTRDDNGNATTVTQANGVVTDSAFDALNRQTSVTTHPTGSTTLTTSSVLNGNGQPTTKTLGDGTVITYAYDTNVRLTSVSATGLSTITFGYDPMGRRTSMVDGTGTTTYSYDGLGRLTQATQPNGTTTYGYDRDSNRTTLGYPTVVDVTYTYSAGGRLSGLTDWASHTAAYTYTASGLAATVTAPGGLTTTYSYDTAHRLIEVLNQVGSTTITDHAYTLDPAGNRTQLDEFVSGITTGTSDPFAYSYDGLERLTAGATTNPESFTLDAGSNITARTGPSASFGYDTSNRLTTDGTNSFTWSNADRLTGRGSDSFSYDPLDRLTSSTVATVGRTYTYNGDGLLQSRADATSGTTFLWDPSSAPSRLLQVNSDRIVYGLGPLYVVKANASTSAFARDGGKSIRAEINGSGTVTASFRYRAYGAISQYNGTPTPSYLGYAGQLLDSSGLYYMRARWYDSAAGRFLTRDPLGGNPSAPASLGAFAYAWASPSMLMDPSGLCPVLEIACLAYYSLGIVISSDEADAAVTAAESGNALIAATGYVELSAGLVAGGSLAVVSAVAVWFDFAALGKAFLYRSASSGVGALSQRIAGGHAFADHASQFEELGIKNESQLANHVESVIRNPSESRLLDRNRSAYWDARSGTVVITDPGNVDGGTVFRPDNGKSYFDALK